MPTSYGGLWQKLVSWDNLYEAFFEAGKGKRETLPVLKFRENLEENLIEIQNRLIWGSWSPGRWREFVVREPKIRFIQAPPFRDRVVHHALVRVIEPLFEKKFIGDSYACRRGKGTHAAVSRLQAFLRAAHRRHGKVYVLKADISRYFPSIDRYRLVNLLARTIRDKNTLALCEKIIRYDDDARGVPVGALTSQLFANVYLDQLDHLVKDQLGYKFYLRYMDDFIVLGPDKPGLWGVLRDIDGFLSCELRLSLNPKTGIFPSSRGVDFAGYRTWTTHVLPRKRNVIRARRKLRSLSGQYRAGLVAVEYVKAVLMSFLGYMKFCSGRETTRNILAETRLPQWVRCKKGGKEARMKSSGFGGKQ
jgi:RNA-directed DNA polymerase